MSICEKFSSGKECPPVATKVVSSKQRCHDCRLREEDEAKEAARAAAKAEVEAQFAAWKGFVCNESSKRPSEPLSPRSKPDEQEEF